MAYKNVNTRKTRRVMFADTEELKGINPDNLELIEDYLSSVIRNMANLVPGAGALPLSYDGDFV